MKSITVTYHYGKNYGATLQAYALQRTLQALGCDNALLELRYSASKSKSAGRSPLAILRKWYLNRLRQKRSGEMATLREHFNAFTKKRLNLTRRYDSMEELRADPPDANLLITGSDQVWNLTSRSDFIPARFLDFGAHDARRISFAASIEKLNYSDAQKEEVKGYLRAFDAISLREESARQYIESFADVKAERILDPVFLLDANAWREIAQPPRISAPYILCYQVQRNRNLPKVAARLRRATGYPIVSICNSSIKWIRSDHTFFDVSIEEFLGFYANASIVVTASFHGTAFGLTFGKPTYGMIKEGSKNRIKEILDLFGMNQFVISEKAEVASIPEPSIDAAALEARIACERDKSLDFIKRNLN